MPARTIVRRMKLSPNTTRAPTPWASSRRRSSLPSRPSCPTHTRVPLAPKRGGNQTRPQVVERQHRRTGHGVARNRHHGDAVEPGRRSAELWLDVALGHRLDIINTLQYCIGVRSRTSPPTEMVIECIRFAVSAADAREFVTAHQGPVRCFDADRIAWASRWPGRRGARPSRGSS